MNPTDRISSTTTFEVLGALWLRDSLIRIEHKLDVLLKASVPHEKLVELTQVADQAKFKSDVLAKAIEENK